MSEKNIYQKLVEVRKSIDSFTKDAEGYGYKYVSGSQILTEIKATMDKEGIILATHLIDPVIGQSNKGYTITSKVGMIWINSEKPDDRLEVGWFMAGEQKDPSQAFGSALTYAERYFLLKFFGIPTDEDDPDNPPNNHKPKTWQVGNVIYTTKDVGELMVKKHKGNKDKAKEDWNIFKDLSRKQQIEIIEKLLEENK